MPNSVSSIDREKLIRDNPLPHYILKQGGVLSGNGIVKTTNHCPVRIHSKGHLCVSVDVSRNIWHCNSHGIGGSIIDWFMQEKQCSVAEAMSKLGGVYISSSTVESVKPQIVATYDYTNEHGDLLYQVVRYEPKDFRQRQPASNGAWNWSMEGATRVVYRLPEVIKASNVIICEGEKDADTLSRLGFVATTNVGGAGKWLDAYSEILKNKDVIICPDNDEKGQEHAIKVQQSIFPYANSVKRVMIPSPHKDVTDYANGRGDLAKAELTKLFEKTPYSLKPTPIYTIQEMEAEYRKHLDAIQTRTLNLGAFLPGLGDKVRRLVPGELMLIMGDTGTGKTMLLQHIAKSASPIPTLIFELELPLPLMFERFVQAFMGCTAGDVEQEYRTNGCAPLWKAYRGLHHIAVCPASRLTTDDIESYIIKSELKFGVRPTLICVDYIGLIKGKSSRSRYEAVSETAEALKVIAKSTDTIIIMASQVSRESTRRDKLEVTLHDAKDSGSCENSAGLVIGVWRPDPARLFLKILKNTKGSSGQVIECGFDGERMKLWQI